MNQLCKAWAKTNICNPCGPQDRVCKHWTSVLSFVCVKFSFPFFWCCILIVYFILSMCCLCAQAYCSILYLKPRMQIVIRGQKVKTELISKSLAYIAKDYYKPNFVVSYPMQEPLWMALLCVPVFVFSCVCVFVLSHPRDTHFVFFWRENRNRQIWVLCSTYKKYHQPLP